ncbi:hypothetical protein R3W88_000865 [Solanum pinnatisectum]|uniref:Uncharacterized protein n=1 Tax=Solanum pinnatisectum TaxID=50273 RepID=A0AAV9MGS4_9SOLN|nr:hypothetical protein R3W88_000865 [Solanum pinnatisectum]
MDQQISRLQKGKARILSIGKVVGDPWCWNVVKDNRCVGSSIYQPSPTVTNKFQALANEENTQPAYSSTDNNSDNNNCNAEINDVSQQRGEEESSKEWVSKSLGKVLCEQKSPERSSSSLGKHDAARVDVQHKQEHPKDNETDRGIEKKEMEKQKIIEETTMVPMEIERAATPDLEPEDQHVRDSNEAETILNTVKSKEGEQQARDEDEDNMNKAIIIVPTAIQTDDSLVVMVHTDSPNSTLHDTITHKVIETESKDSKDEQISTFSDSKEEQIFKDADLSHRVMKVHHFCSPGTDRSLMARWK